MGSGRSRSRDNGLLLVGVGVDVGFRARRGTRRGVRLLFGIAGVLAVVMLNDAVRGAGRRSVSWAQPAEELAESPRAQGSDEVVGQPLGHEPPAEAVEIIAQAQQNSQEPQGRNVGEYGPHDDDRLPPSGLLEELSGDGYQHLEEGEDAHEAIEVHVFHVHGIGDRESGQEDHVEDQVSDDERHDASWVPRFCPSSICVFGAGGVLRNSRINGIDRGAGRRSVSWAQQVEELAESPRAQGGDEVVGQPLGHEPPAGAVGYTAHQPSQEPQDCHVGKYCPRDRDNLPRSGLFEELSGDGYQHLEEGEDAHEAKEVDEGQVREIGDREPDQEDHVEHQVPDKEVNNPSRVTLICHAPILTGFSAARSSHSSR